MSKTEQPDESPSPSECKRTLYDPQAFLASLDYKGKDGRLLVVDATVVLRLGSHPVRFAPPGSRGRFTVA